MALLLPARAEEGAPQEAAEAAAAFVEQLDAGSYEQSWEGSGSLLKGRIARDEWERQQAFLRPLFGGVVGRTLLTATPRDSYPGVPDGTFVIVVFETRFEHKARAVETAVAMLEPDGDWRVIYYLLR